MALLFNKNYNREELNSLVGDLSQIAPVRYFVLDDGKASGVKGIEITTGGGLTFKVLPGRGMDIGETFFKGIPLSFMSATGITSPAYYEESGRNWLRSFFGGLLTTCGITSAGTPNLDQGIAFGLNGRVANAEAESVSLVQEWRGNEYAIAVSGKIRESAFNGENVLLTRCIETRLGAKGFTLTDTIENLGFEPVPLTMIYHINFGWPLLSPSSRVILPSLAVEPYDEASSDPKELVHWDRFEKPVVSKPRLLVMHKMAANEEGLSFYSLINPDGPEGSPIGILIRYNVQELPKITQLKQMRAGTYVTTFEPGTVSLHGRGELRKRSELPFLASQESYSIHLYFEVLTSIDEFTDLERKRQELVEKTKQF